MDVNGEQRVLAERLGDELVDRLSNLPESLLLQVLLNLPTKDVVRCSVLSSRWRNLWKFVPALDLYYSFSWNLDDLASFVDRFLGFNSESRIQKFNLDSPWSENFTWWINTVVERKVQHLCVSNSLYLPYQFKTHNPQVEIPPTVLTCESLVSLELNNVFLANPEFVSLPCVKVITLDRVQFDNNLSFEISSCPVLESLAINRYLIDGLQVLRVRSQSLLRFTYWSNFHERDRLDRKLVVDAPKLEYLELTDFDTASFIINNTGSLVKANIDIESILDRLSPEKINMIQNFLVAISNVKEMEIDTRTLEVIYRNSRYEPLPIFPNLSFLDVRYGDHKWEMLLIFLGRCPNLKSLVMVNNIYSEEDVTDDTLPGARCFLSSLEYVKLVKPVSGGPMKMELVSYFMENSPNLKKLTLSLE